MVVLHVTQRVSFKCTEVLQFYVKCRVAVLRMTQGGNFTYNRGWRVAFLHIIQSNTSSFNTGGSFTYFTVWQFYV